MTPDDRDSTHFYGRLPAMASFSEATQARLHAEVPSDWWIVVADVEGSTRAIEAGLYKKVNTIGVACIAAVVNVDRGIAVPFVFGGDGATFAVPAVLHEGVMRALRAAERLAREGFGLTLRIGMIRVGDLVEQGFPVRLGKVVLSSHVTQPVLSGRGWEEAERMVKTPGMPGMRTVSEDDGPAEASFEGFECRWQGVPSFNGHKLALLVSATVGDADASHDIYLRVLDRIEAVYGDVAAYHPLRAERMRMSFRPRLLFHEWRVRSGHLGWGGRLAYGGRMIFQNLAGCYLFARKLDTAEVRWSRYRDEMVENSDFRKFDGTLRMVMDGSDAQAALLESWLEEEYRAGRLVYGTHKSREALVTCIVQSHNGNHQHFVDGGDGGYALAARELKRRMAVVRRSLPFEPE